MTAGGTPVGQTVGHSQCPPRPSKGQGCAHDAGGGWGETSTKGKDTGYKWNRRSGRRGSKAQAPSYKINTLTKLYCAFESR